MADATNQPQHVLFRVDEDAGRAFYWLSIALAVLTALLQGLVAALAFMTESSNRWTFRFRLALLEHWWWWMVSSLLLASLVMVTLSFVSGNGGDGISVLALSSATFLAIVQYTLPAWQARNYARTRWLAWTGPSRSAIKRSTQKFCGDAQCWKRLIKANAKKLAELQPTPSDYYGWRLWPVKGMTANPIDTLTLTHPHAQGVVDVEAGEQPVGVYYNHVPDSENVSLLWGPAQGFRRVVSRAVSSMPLGLLQTSPSTVDGYDGKGLTSAMGILGRNKGLLPWELVFHFDRVVSVHMEMSSTWSPRPTKVLRSFYKSTMKAQYGGMGEQYVDAATELALILADAPHWATDRWLLDNLEHQDIAKNAFLQGLRMASEEERLQALEAHYKSSYVSMIVSLNHMKTSMRDRRGSGHVPLGRPDLLCVAVYLKAKALPEPSWWNRPEVCAKIRAEIDVLPQDLDWRTTMARLLGLNEWPAGIEDVPGAEPEGSEEPKTPAVTSQRAL